MNGTPRAALASRHRQLASSLLPLAVLIPLGLGTPARAQEPELDLDAPRPAIAPLAPEAVPPLALELSLGAGVSVDTLHPDGSAQTGLLPSVSLAVHRGLLLAGALFDLDPSADVTTASGSVVSGGRQGWHLGAAAGPSFALGDRLRLDVSAELGVHHAEDVIAQPTVTYATSASLPYFGVRPALSARLGEGKYSGAIGLAAFFRVDAGQRQSGGLPDDGGHQLGAELFLSLRVELLAGR